MIDIYREYELGSIIIHYHHSLPYEDGISEDLHHDLFVNVGHKEELQQKFFQSLRPTPQFSVYFNGGITTEVLPAEM